MYKPKKRPSAAARPAAAPGVLAGLHRRREGCDLVQGSAVERVVDPTAFPAIETRCGAKNLLVQPAIDDALPKAPLLPQLGRRNPLLLRPFVNGLRCEPEVRRDLFNRQDVVVERRCAALVIIPGHGSLRRRVVSATVSTSGSTRPRNRGSVSGLTDGEVGLSSPCISL